MGVGGGTRAGGRVAGPDLLGPWKPPAAGGT